MGSNILGTGVSGLLVAQRALEVTANNIANANTEGYSRQVVEQAALKAQLTGGGYIGKGVEVTNVARRYDQFISNQLRASRATFGEVDQYKQLAGQLDNFLSDSASGLSTVMSDFFSAANKVADTPNASAARSVLLSNAENFTQRFNSINARFESLNLQVVQNTTTMTEQINNYAAVIAELNDKIAVSIGQANGNHQPNDLLDQRDTVLGKLSELITVSVVPQSNGMTSVFIGQGQPLVLDKKSNTLSTAPSKTDPKQLDIILTTPINSQAITQQLDGGALGGTLRFKQEMLDPEQQNLKNIGETFAAEVNKIHQAGFDLEGNAGGNLFTYDATTGKLSADITDPKKLAASRTAATIPGDNRNALALAQLQNIQVDVLHNGSPTGTKATFQEAYGQIVSNVGNLTNAANLSAAAQESLLNNARAAHESISGVNLDEEAANLLKYQQAYQAAAQLISVTKGLFDSLLGAFR